MKELSGNTGRHVVLRHPVANEQLSMTHLAPAVYQQTRARRTSSTPFPPSIRSCNHRSAAVKPTSLCNGFRTPLTSLSLCILLCSTCLALCHPEGTAIVRTNGTKYRDIHTKTIFYQSSNAPLTSVIARYPQVVNSTKIIQDYLKSVEKHLFSVIFHNVTTSSKPPLNACRATKWIEWWKLNVCRTYVISNWPEIPLSCVSEVSDVQLQAHNYGIDVNRLWNAIHTRATAFRSLINELGKAIAPNITHARPSLSFRRYQSRGMKCLMHIVVGHRVKPGGEFHAVVRIQNSPQGFFIPDSNNMIFLEYPAVINGTLGHNLRMRLPLQNLQAGQRIWKTDATTMRRKVRNEPLRVTRFTPMTIAENPSIELALEKADTDLQQLANILLPSTLSILFLPLLLTLIPISCFSYVSTLQALGYILLTDVLTTAPLTIKGVELLHIYRKRFRTVVVRMTSDFNRNGVYPKSATAETWASECRTEDRVGRIGSVFLGIAILAFVFGTALEMIMFYVARRRRKLIFPVEETEYSKEFRGSSFRSLGIDFEEYDQEYE